MRESLSSFPVTRESRNLGQGPRGKEPEEWERTDSFALSIFWILGLLIYSKPSRIWCKTFPQSKGKDGEEGSPGWSLIRCGTSPFPKNPEKAHLPTVFSGYQLVCPGFPFFLQGHKCPFPGPTHSGHALWWWGPNVVQRSYPWHRKNKVSLLYWILLSSITVRVSKSNPTLFLPLTRGSPGPRFCTCLPGVPRTALHPLWPCLFLPEISPLDQAPPAPSASVGNPIRLHLDFSVFRPLGTFSAADSLPWHLFSSPLALEGGSCFSPVSAAVLHWPWSHFLGLHSSFRDRYLLPWTITSRAPPGLPLSTHAST